MLYDIADSFTFKCVKAFKHNSPEHVPFAFDALWFFDAWNSSHEQFQPLFVTKLLEERVEEG